MGSTCWVKTHEDHLFGLVGLGCGIMVGATESGLVKSMICCIGVKVASSSWFQLDMI